MNEELRPDTNVISRDKLKSDLRFLYSLALRQQYQIDALLDAIRQQSAPVARAYDLAFEALDDVPDTLHRKVMGELIALRIEELE